MLRVVSPVWGFRRRYAGVWGVSSGFLAAYPVRGWRFLRIKVAVKDLGGGNAHVSRGAGCFRLHVSRKSGADIKRIASATVWGLKKEKANRLVDRMERYVPKGIVGHKQVIKFLIKNNCVFSGDVFILR
jgi:hypothetical protein